MTEVIDGQFAAFGLDLALGMMAGHVQVNRAGVGTVVVVHRSDDGEFVGVLGEQGDVLLKLNARRRGLDRLELAANVDRCLRLGSNDS